MNITGNMLLELCEMKARQKHTQSVDLTGS